MAKVKVTNELIYLSRQLKEAEARITELTGSKKPGAVATEVLQLDYLKNRGFKNYYLDDNCALAGVDAVSETQPSLQLKNTEGEKSSYTGGKSSPMHLIAEKAVKCDENAYLVFTRMKAGVVVDCVVGFAEDLLDWRTSSGKGVQTANFTTLVRDFNFERI